MTKHKILPLTDPLSRLATIRLQASAIWRGPKDITWDAEIKNEPPFYGWLTLSLEITTGQTDFIESRAVYANLFDNSQRFAILRAVYWNGKLVREAIKSRTDIKDEDFLVMPARFVKLPVEQVKTWLSEFDGVSVAVKGSLSDDNTINIRRLRIEQDFKTCVFEKVWQVQDKNHNLLNQKWDRVWAQMTQTLTSEPVITNFDEDFWFVNPKIVYEFQSYQPDWFDFT